MFQDEYGYVEYEAVLAALPMLQLVGHLQSPALCVAPSPPQVHSLSFSPYCWCFAVVCVLSDPNY